MVEPKNRPKNSRSLGKVHVAKGKSCERAFGRFSKSSLTLWAETFPFVPCPSLPPLPSFFASARKWQSFFGRQILLVRRRQKVKGRGTEEKGISFFRECVLLCVWCILSKKKSIFLGKNLEIIPSVRQMEQLERSNMKFNKF